MRIMQGDELAGPRQSNPEPAEQTYSMKCAGWKCSLGLSRLLGTILLAVVLLSAQQTPATSATPSTTASSPATPEIPKAVNEKAGAAG